jgi:ABC-type Fe3+ transport system permease subunit
MLRLVPASLREAAVALGAPMWRVILQVTLRAVRGGVITGVLLAVAAISGETAPLLFTALNNQFWTADMNAPMANLPVVIFQFAMSPFDDWKTLAWAAALLITLTVLVINILARTVFRQSGRVRTPSDGSSQGVDDESGSGRLRPEAAGIEHVAAPEDRLPQGRLLLRPVPRAEERQPRHRRAAGDGVHRPSGCGKSTLLRTLNRMYSLYPGQRRPARSSSTARTSSIPASISTCCAPRSGWCSRSRRRSRCRSTTTSRSA